MKSVRIYAMTHKLFEAPENSLYQPVFVGHALQKPDVPVNYLTDDTGEHISLKNPYYSELTGMYWVWKNCKDAIVGICHYRRYLLNEKGKVFSAGEIEALLKSYGMITTKKIQLDYTYEEGFSGKHHQKDLILTGEVLQQYYPEYAELFQEAIHQNTTYFGNMIITTKECYDAYCAWLFGVLFLVEKRVDMTGYNDYQKRLYGFLSELLLMVYIKKHKLTVYEADVAVIGEKKETREAKEQLIDYLKKKELSRAKEYFWSLYQKRPDVLMEASDPGGELKLLLQLLTTMDYEQQLYGEEYPLAGHSLEENLELLREINRQAKSFLRGEFSEEKPQLLQDKKFSSIGCIIALKIAGCCDIKIQECFLDKLKKDDAVSF